MIKYVVFAALALACFALAERADFKSFQAMMDKEVPAEGEFVHYEVYEPKNNPENAVGIHINTDNIFNKVTDGKMLKCFASEFAAKGYRVTIGGIGPNYHYSEVTQTPQNGYYMPIFGGACAGTLYEMISSDWYKSHLKAKNAKMVVAFISPPSKNIHNLDWLPRAHDDDFSPSWFKGLSWPEKKLWDAGFGVAIGKSPGVVISHFPGFKPKEMP